MFIFHKKRGQLYPIYDTCPRKVWTSKLVLQVVHGKCGQPRDYGDSVCCKQL